MAVRDWRAAGLPLLPPSVVCCVHWVVRSEITCTSSSDNSAPRKTTISGRGPIRVPAALCFIDIPFVFVSDRVSGKVRYTVRNMSMLLLAGIVLTGFPLLLIIGFAGYIFLGFVNDDKDARAILNVVLAVMGIGIALILTHFITKMIIVTP